MKGFCLDKLLRFMLLLLLPGTLFVIPGVWVWGWFIKKPVPGRVFFLGLPFGSRACVSRRLSAPEQKFSLNNERASNYLITGGF